MMKHFALALAAAMMTVTACYDAPFPLGHPADETVDPELIGIWDPVPAEDDDDVRPIAIYAFNEFEYLVLYTEEDGGVVDTVMARAFTVTVAGESFASIRNLALSGEELPYFFARYRWLDTNRIAIRIVPHDAIADTVSTPYDLWRAFEVAVVDSTLLRGEGEVIFRRRAAD